LRGLTWCLAGALSLSAQPLVAQRNAPPAIQLEALSTRSDLVSGGDVLVQLAMAEGAAGEPVSVMLNGRDVTSAFRATTAPHVRLGLVRDLRLGKNELVHDEEGS
jgi:hypothetical protein